MNRSCSIAPAKPKQAPVTTLPRCYLRGERSFATESQALAVVSAGMHVPLRQDISADELLTILEKFRGDEVVRPYAVTTVKLKNGNYQQGGSAPNFDGGLATLCTCKHQMRSRYTPENWTSGVWVLGLASKSLWKQGEQTFYYLMRVEATHASQADLVRALQMGGQEDVIAAKDSRTNQLGDLYIPEDIALKGNKRFNPSSYVPPMSGHVHSRQDNPLQWHNDLWYQTGDCAPPLLVGDPKFTFTWSRPLIKRRHPSDIRDYQNQNLAWLRREIMGAQV